MTRLGQHSIINECVGQRWKQFRAFSSAGRAPALQAGGHRFEPYNAHHYCGLVVQLVRMPACHAGGRRFEPVPGRHRFLDTISKQYIMCWRGSTVEQLICNQQVGGSIPSISSNISRDSRVAKGGGL